MNYILSIMLNDEEKFLKHQEQPETNMGPLTNFCDFVKDPNRTRVEDTKFHFTPFEVCQIISENAVRVADIIIETIPANINSAYERYSLKGIDMETVEFLNRIEKESQSKFLAVILNPNADSVAQKEVYDISVGESIHQVNVAGTVVGDIHETVRYFNSDKVGLTENFLKDNQEQAETVNRFGFTAALMLQLKEQGMEGSIVGFVAATHTMDHEYIIPYEFTQIAPVQLCTIQEPVEPEVPSKTQVRYRLFFGSKVLAYNEKGYHFIEEGEAEKQFFLLSTVLMMCLQDIQYMYKYEVREYDGITNSEVVNSGNIVSDFVVNGVKENKVSVVFINAKRNEGEEFAFFGDMIFARTNQPIPYVADKFNENEDFRAEVRARMERNDFAGAIGTYYNSQEDKNHDFYINRIMTSEILTSLNVDIKHSTDVITVEILVNGRNEFNDDPIVDLNGKWSVKYYEETRAVYCDELGNRYYIDNEENIGQMEFIQLNVAKVSQTIIRQASKLKELIVTDLGTGTSYVLGKDGELDYSALTEFKAVENSYGMKAVILDAVKDSSGHFTLGTKLIKYGNIATQAVTTNASVETLKNEIVNDNGILESMNKISTLTPSDVAEAIFKQYEGFDVNRVLVIEAYNKYVDDIVLEGCPELKEPVIPEPEFKPYYTLGFKDNEKILWGSYSENVFAFSLDENNERHNKKEHQLTFHELVSLLAAHIRDYADMIVEYVTSKESIGSYEEIAGITKVLEAGAQEYKVNPSAVKEQRDEAIDADRFEVGSEGLQRPEYYIMQNLVVLRTGVNLTDLLHTEINASNLSKLKLNTSNLGEIFKAAYYGKKEVITHILWFDEDTTHYYHFGYLDDPEVPEEKPLKERRFAVIAMSGDEPKVYHPKTARFELVANVVNWTGDKKFIGHTYLSTEANPSLYDTLDILIHYRELYGKHTVVLWNENGYEFIPNTPEGRAIMDEITQFIGDQSKKQDELKAEQEFLINNQLLELKVEDFNVIAKSINRTFDLELHVGTDPDNGCIIISDAKELDEYKEYNTDLIWVKRRLYDHDSTSLRHKIYSGIVVDEPKTLNVTELALVKANPYLVILQIFGYTMIMDQYDKEDIIAAILYLRIKKNKDELVKRMQKNYENSVIEADNRGHNK